MLIRCWGSRGSSPVSGQSFLKYGGDTTCLEIRTADNNILIIDAGTGIRRLGNRLLEKKKYQYHLFFTHIHLDHIIGFPFFNPIYSEKTLINIYGCSGLSKSPQSALASIMRPPYFPVDFKKIKAKLKFYEINKNSFRIGSSVITFIPINHPDGGVGFKIKEGDRSFVFITDNELMEQYSGGETFQSYIDFVRNADLLIHDAEFTPEEYEKKKLWGHSSYKDALQLALDADVRHFGLFHHSQDRNDAEIDTIVQNCQNIIRQKQSLLDCFAVSEDFIIEL